MPALVAVMAAATLVTLLIITSALASPADELSQTNDQISNLQSQGSALDESYNQALQELVALDMDVQRYEGDITAARQKSEDIQAGIAAREQKLADLKQQLQQRQAALEKRLTSFYKSDDMGYIKVVVGAGDFSEFLNRVDMVNRIADEDEKLIDSYKEARAATEAELAALDASRAELAALLESLNSAEQELLSARAEQQSYVTSLESQMAANGGQLAQLQAQAANIEAEMNRIQAAVAAPVYSGGDYNPPPAGGSSFTMTATAYCLTGSTATGMPAGPGVIAVDPGVIPLGSQVHVSGYGNAIAADTGGSIIGSKIDVWLPCSDAYAWGVRTVTVTIY